MVIGRMIFVTFLVRIGINFIVTVLICLFDLHYGLVRLPIIEGDLREEESVSLFKAKV